MYVFLKGLWKEHPIFRQLLGMCPTLAVTNTARNGLFMGLAVIFVLFFASCIVSLIKKIIPHEVRIAVYTVIIATLVTIVDIFFKAFFPDVSRALGPYVPLIIVNCIILGRCEAFASKNRLLPSLLDALGMGVGFCWGLFLLGSIRELFGSGNILGFTIFPACYNPLVVMILPAGAFLVLGFLVSAMNCIENRRKR
ncbi:MAG: RnfABCDGE type electron transport complex subunit E [Candidatus Omnitrophica bacterium]|nr:RnfABCDGE type electron transport complex subunit E [Candidatus Omnitrophota bacterium]MBD3268944.1 RnfABCDGE type electron transport complex subunit E [Candidatus Omnitrophota bacterium]